MRILFVRLRLIGDVVFTTPLLGAVRRRFPDATLTYLVESAAAPVVRHHPALDEVIEIPHRRGWRRVADDLRLARRLRAARFDVAVDLHGGPRSGWLTWASRAPVRVGYDVAGRAWMYTRVVHRPRALRPRHSVANQWDLLAAVDPSLAAPPDPDHDRVTMAVAPGAREAAGARLGTWGVATGDRLVVLHVSAGNPFRRWPEASFATLAAGLARGGADRRVLVTSGPSDHAAAARVVEAARRQSGNGASRIVDAEGCSLVELRALLDRAAVFVGGDSGPLHIAATTDVPVVGLYGPTLPERSAPWRPSRVPTVSIDAGTLPCRPCEQRHCEPGDFRCLTTIAPEAVLAAAERCLAVEGGR
ncbi:MAG: glycosyltransferase family 9 protein [Vicinamibacterales bacterium]